MGRSNASEDWRIHPLFRFRRFPAAGWTLGLGILLLASSADAGKVVGYFNAGTAIPDAPVPFSEGWDPGFGISVGMGFRLGPWMECGGSFSLDSFGVNEATRDEALSGEYDLNGAEVIGGDSSVQLLQGEVRIFLPISLSRISPYLSGAAGLFRRSFEDITISTDDLDEIVSADAESAFTASAGAGVGFRLTRELWFMIEGAYTTGFTDVQTTRYFPLRAGFAFH